MLRSRKPKPSPGPAELAHDPVAAAEWARLAPLIQRSRTMTESDRAALLTLCQQWSYYVDATAQVARLGLVVKAPSGAPMANPYLQIADRAHEQCAKLRRALCLYAVAGAE